MFMSPEMPVAAIARMTGEHDTRLWRVIHAHVEDARERVDMKEVKALVVDETARARYAAPRDWEVFVVHGA